MKLQNDNTLSAFKSLVLVPLIFLLTMTTSAEASMYRYTYTGAPYLLYDDINRIDTTAQMSISFIYDGDLPTGIIRPNAVTISAGAQAYNLTLANGDYTVGYDDEYTPWFFSPSIPFIERVSSFSLQVDKTESGLPTIWNLTAYYSMRQYEEWIMHDHDMGIDYLCYIDQGASQNISTTSNGSVVVDEFYGLLYTVWDQYPLPNMGTGAYEGDTTQLSAAEHAAMYGWSRTLFPNPNPNPIPIPASLLLLGSGLLGLLVNKRRNKRL